MYLELKANVPRSRMNSKMQWALFVGEKDVALEKTV